MNRTTTARTPPLTLGQARKLMLAAQGLLARPSRRARPDDVVAAVTRMALLQIDTIHVVARSPYLVLFSRLGAYEPTWLDRALETGRIFECWSHEACFAPAGAFALHRANAGSRNLHWAAKHAQRTYASHRASMEALLASIGKSGPVRAADFNAAEKPAGLASKGWWGWKDEKRWLEAWFALGELMVARRERFQRVYDLTSRVRPDAASLELPPPEAVRRAFVLESIRALGVVPAKFVADYFRLKPRVTDAELAPLVASGELVETSVAPVWERAYVHASNEALLATAAAGRLRATHATLLSPFDPVVWDRERASELFGFDYRIECYTPEAKRRFGYFVLPILDRGRLIGRLDAKAHRAEGVFEVKRVYLEEGVSDDDGTARAIHGAVEACARWHGTPRVTYGPTEPRGLRKRLQGQAR